MEIGVSTLNVGSGQPIRLASGVENAVAIDSHERRPGHGGHRRHVLGIDIGPLAGGINSGGAGPCQQNLINQGIPLAIVRGRRELGNQSSQTAASILRHRLLQIRDSAETAQIWQSGNIGWHRHRSRRLTV